MRVLLLALPLFALLPVAHAHEGPEPAHGALPPHEHGVGTVNLALDGQTLEIELDSPAINIFGFEHPASNAQDRATISTALQQLAKPATLFALPAAARCSVARQAVDSPLFGKTADGDHDGHEHADVHAHYQFQCDNPSALSGIGFAPWFEAFPGTHRLTVQAITGTGQRAMEATPGNDQLAF